MHKHIGLIVVIAVIAIVSIVPGAIDKLFALFFVGLIPYTTYTIPPSAMLLVYGFLLALGVYGIARQLATAASPVKREIDSRERARKKILQDTRLATKKTSVKPKKHFLSAVEHSTS